MDRSNFQRLQAGHCIDRQQKLSKKCTLFLVSIWLAQKLARSDVSPEKNGLPQFSLLCKLLTFPKNAVMRQTYLFNWIKIAYNF